MREHKLDKVALVVADDIRVMADASVRIKVAVSCFKLVDHFGILVIIAGIINPNLDDNFKILD